MAIGLASFPGIAQIIRCSYTLSHGITPGAFVLEIAPQAMFPTHIGPMVLTFGAIAITFPNCRVNFVSFSRNSRGLVWSLQIFDRRWKWAWRTISGRYNLRLDDENLDTTTEKTPQQLATLLLQTLGESAFDVSQLSNGTRPIVQWDNENAAQALATLCDSLGCHVVMQLNGTVKICQVGAGATLPNLPELMDDAGTLDPAEVPDYLRIMFAPTRIQAMFLLEAVGLDTDGKIKLLDDLSYKPANGWGREAAGFFSGVANSPAAVQSGQLDKNPRTLALRTVFKWYRIKEVHDSTWVEKVRPQLGQVGAEFSDFNLTTKDQFLPLLPDLIDIDATTKKNAKPFVQGVFSTRGEGGPWRNSADWTNYRRPINLLQDKGIVEFQDYVYKWINPGVAPVAGQASIQAATLYLSASFHLQHHLTRSTHRHYREIQLGPINGTGAKVVKEEDLGATVRTNYNAGGAVQDFTTNYAALDPQAVLALSAALTEFQLTTPQDKTYAGLVPLNPDGAIFQVTWTMEESRGCTTRASRNNEWNYNLPSYKERRVLERLRSGENLPQQLRRENWLNRGNAT